MTPNETSPQVETTRESLWSVGRRELVIGIVLTITLVAFEAMSVATVMPEVKEDLGGLALYGWVFAGFSLASLAGVVVAGLLVDRKGLAFPYVVGLGMFSGGLVVGGAATSMEMLVVGRVLQGFGAGAVPAMSYAAIARGVPASLRPKMFAVMSTAWVVPGLVGPVAALAIEHALSWRAVFLALLPVVAIALVVTLPALRRLDRDLQVSRVNRTPEKRLRDRARLGQIGLLVLAVGAILYASSVSLWAVVAALSIFGLGVGGYALRNLLPAGSLRFKAGVPAAISIRALLTFAFFAADAYIPLAVVDGRGGEPWMGGLALTASALLWSTGSWQQARLVGSVGPRKLCQYGFSAMAVGAATLVAMAAGGPVWLVVAAWAIGGYGIGLAYAPISVTVLGETKAGEEGELSSSLQLTDGLGITLGTGLGGWIVAFGDSQNWQVSSSVTLVFLMAGSAAIAGAVASGRLPRQLSAGAQLGNS